jgi:hypothetical protein
LPRPWPERHLTRLGRRPVGRPPRGAGGRQLEHGERPSSGWLTRDVGCFPLIRSRRGGSREPFHPLHADLAAGRRDRLVVVVAPGRCPGGQADCPPEGSARPRAAGRGARRASRRDRDPAPRRAHDRAECRAGGREAAPEAPRQRSHADCERREGVQRRGRAAARPGGEARPGRHDRPAATQPPRCVAIGDGEADAQPHERAAGLHAVEGVRRPRADRSGRVRLPDGDHQLRPG